MAKITRKQFNTIFPDADAFEKKVMDGAITSLGYTKGDANIPFYLTDGKRPFKGIQFYHILKNAGADDWVALDKEAVVVGKMINWYTDMSQQMFGKMLRLGNDFLVKLTYQNLSTNLVDNYHVDKNNDYLDGEINETINEFSELPKQSKGSGSGGLGNVRDRTRSSQNQKGKARQEFIDIGKAFSEIEFELTGFTKEILRDQALINIWDRYFDYDEEASLEIGLDLKHFLDQFTPGLFKTNATTGKLEFVVPAVDPKVIDAEIKKALANLSIYTKTESDAKYETKEAANTVAAEVTNNTNAISSLNAGNGARDAKISNNTTKVNAANNRSIANAGKITKLEAGGSGIKKIDATGKTFDEVKALITEDELVEFSWAAGGSAKKIIGFTHTSTDTKIIVSGVTTDGEIEHLDLNKTNAGGINYVEEHIESPQIETNKNDITSIKTTNTNQGNTLTSHATKIADNEADILALQNEEHTITNHTINVSSLNGTKITDFKASLNYQSAYTINGEKYRYSGEVDSGSRVTAKFFTGTSRQLKFIDVRVNYSSGTVTSADTSPYAVNIGIINNDVRNLKKDVDIHHDDIADIQGHFVKDIGLVHRISEFNALSAIDVDNQDLNSSGMSAQIKFEQIIQEFDKHKEFTKGILKLENVTAGAENDVLDYIKGYTGNVKQTDLVWLVKDNFDEIDITLLGKVSSTYKQWKYSVNGNLTTGASKTIDKAAFDKEIADFKAGTLGINSTQFKFKDKNGVERTLQYVIDNAGGVDPQVAINKADIDKNKENVNTIVKHENTLQREVIKNINDLYKLGIRHADPTFLTEKSFGRNIQKTTNFKDNIRTLFDHLGDNKHLLLHIPNNDPNLPKQHFQEQIIAYMRQEDASIDANLLNNAYFMIKAGAKSSNTVRYEIYLTTLPGREPFPNAKWNKNETNTKTYKPATSIKYVFDYSPNLVTNEALTKGDYRSNWETFNKGYESSIVEGKVYTQGTDYGNVAELIALLKVSNRVTLVTPGITKIFGTVVALHGSTSLDIIGTLLKDGKYSYGRINIDTRSGNIVYEFKQTENLKSLPVQLKYKAGLKFFDDIYNNADVTVGRVVVATTNTGTTIHGVIITASISKTVIAGTTTDGDFEHITISANVDGSPKYVEENWRYKNVKRVLEVNDRQTTGVISSTSTQYSWHPSLAHRNVKSNDANYVTYNTGTTTATFVKPGIYEVAVRSQFYDCGRWASICEINTTHNIIKGDPFQFAYNSASQPIHLGAHYTFTVKIETANTEMQLRNIVKRARGSAFKHGDSNILAFPSGSPAGSGKMPANTITITYKGGV